MDQGNDGPMTKDGSFTGVKVTVPKTAFPQVLTAAGFNSIDGFVVDSLTGTATIVADGYYMQVIGETVITQKTALPATLTDELCGSDACVGGLKLGDAGAPT